jgi:hypothetical protein
MEMRSTTEIDSAIAEVNQKIDLWHKEEQQCSETLRSLSSVIDRYAYAAMSGDDSAVKKLDKGAAEEQQLKVKVRKLTAAIEGAHREVETLSIERAASHRAERLEEFKKISATAQDQAHWLSTSFSGLAKSIGEHSDTMHKLAILAREVGINDASLDIAHCWRYLQTELHLARPREFSRPVGDWQQLKSTRYDLWLEQLLARRVNQTDDETIKETGTN